MYDAINRLNRDRKGGHMTNLSSLRCQSTSPTVNKLYKKQTRKKMRRQHDKVITEGVAAYYQGLVDDWARNNVGDLLDDGHDSFYDQQTYLEYINQKEQEQYEQDHDPRDYDHLFDDGPFYGIADGYDPYDRPSRSVQRSEQVSMHAPFWTSNREFSVEHEIIDKRDAGKTLGELLRERASR